MKTILSRRNALKLAAAGMATGAVACSPLKSRNTLPKSNMLQKAVTNSWENTFDRTWIGGEYWANPMENWGVKNGRAECSSTGGNRSIHSLTNQIENLDHAFTISVNIKREEFGANDGGGGIRLGIHSELNEFKSNCFVNKGIDAGILANQLMLGSERIPMSEVVENKEITLTLAGKPHMGMFALSLEARTISSGKVIGKLTHIVQSKNILGNLGLVSNFLISSEKDSMTNGCRYSFAEWQMSGKAFSYKPEQKFGPILWTMYTLDDTRSSEGFVLKLSALTGPLGENDNQEVELQVNRQGTWQSLGKSTLDQDAWVATFRITNWDEKQSTSFRVVYDEKHIDKSTTQDVYAGTIKANPVGRKMKMAALTCQNDYGFPYSPVAENVVKLDPDLVFFSGDQIYETHGGFGLIREPAPLAILNYLRKYYQFGWAFREAMRNAPTVVLPDDHDVLQGNLWGEGGDEMQLAEGATVDISGGYIEPIRMINAVHLSHTSHHPDPVDPTPAKRGMSVYYTEMVYGEVGFAILADRQWKSGPEKLNITVGKSGQNEDPLYVNPNYDHNDLDLLGKRQEAFLSKWSKDWRGQSLKAVLSQTVFAGISTHQPEPKRYLKYDFDSSGWPASARNRTIEIMRESKALHICGDTHLGTISQYGVHQQRDSNWAFCTPAIAAGWPRWWLPEKVGLPLENKPLHGLANTGECADSFGNKMYVYAVGNPVVGKSENRYIKAHEKGSGFGFIEFDTKAKTYTTHAFRFLVDVEDVNSRNQFDGWPVTIHQDENIGKNRIL